MCLHYLVKLIVRVLSPYITYFSIQVMDENDCERVLLLLLKEDSFNMNCDLWCNSVVATVHSDYAV